MSLLKCPECGRDVSSTLDACPHCGYKIENTTEILRDNADKLKEITDKPKESADKPIVVIKRNANVPSTMCMVFIIIGVLLLICIIGLTFLILGILFQRMIYKNNSQVKDILYYDSNTNMFTAYDIKGKAYKISKDNISKLVTVKQGARNYTGVIYKRKIQLGWTNVEDNNNFRRFLQNM